MTTQTETLLELLDDMFINGELGLRPHRNDNGADWYECPSCASTIKSKGFAYRGQPLDLTTDYGEFKHESDCNMMKLRQLAREMRAAKEKVE
jgi:hypothetical protein